MTIDRNQKLIVKKGNFFLRRKNKNCNKDFVVFFLPIIFFITFTTLFDNLEISFSGETPF